MLSNTSAKNDTTNTLERSLAALEAQLIHITGESAKPFSMLIDDIRDNYLLGCSILAGNCRELVERLNPQPNSLN